ncbi:hypothetical protein [Micromonospora sp. CA-111912]|uniref:hypothetical protein n=1 Tax=Micromonospora sp. CA-111912 TaxID=3239955 RepID=UPI003D93AD08
MGVPLNDIEAQMREVGFLDVVTDRDLRDVPDYLTSASVEPFRDYARTDTGRTRYPIDNDL